MIAYQVPAVESTGVGATAPEPSVGATVPSQTPAVEPPVPETIQAVPPTLPEPPKPETIQAVPPTLPEPPKPETIQAVPPTLPPPSEMPESAEQQIENMVLRQLKAAPAAETLAAGNGGGGVVEKVNWSSHKNEGMRLSRFVDTHGAEFPHMQKMFEGSKKEWVWGFNS